MISFVWKGNSAVYVKVKGQRILIDPASSFSLGDVEALGGLDAVLFTHEHSDHFDLSTLEGLVSKFDSPVVCNPGVYKVLRRRRRGEGFLKIKDGEMLKLGGMTVHALKAVHPGYHPLVLLLEIGNFSLFHGGATGFSRSFQAFSPVDLAFIPVGYPSPTSTPSEALRIAKVLAPRVAVPIHGTDEERREFSEKIKKAKLNLEVISPFSGEEITLTF